MPKWVKDGDFLRGLPGVSVTTADLNEDGELVVQLSNGSSVNAGVVKGPQGDGGADAFQLAKDQGFVGELDDWLDSLSGAPGLDGPRGLQGEDGPVGPSAYELAVENDSFTGTLNDWLSSLEGPSGTNGVDGKSAYQAALDGGYSGTQSAWLASLKGAAGTNGKTAYEVAVAGGYVGTEANWLASLKGAKGDTGSQGIKGDAGTGIAIAGGVATYANLPTNLTSGDAGKGYLNQADGKLYIWSGTAFPASGSGAQFKGDKGDTGTIGADGKTAFQVAQTGGYTGTQAEWLASLKGAKGDAGNQGTPGTNGTNGSNGKSAYELALTAGFVGTQAEYLASLKGADGADAELPDVDLVSIYTQAKLSSQDTTPPSITAFAGVESDVTIAFGYDGTDNVGVKLFTLKRDGVTKYEGPLKSFTDSGLVKDTEYTYTLTCTDYAGNVSQTSTLTKRTLLLAGQQFADAFVRSNRTGGWGPAVTGGDSWSTFFGQTNTGSIASNIAKVPSESSSILRQFKAPVTLTTDKPWAQFDIVGLPTGSSRIHMGPLVRATDGGAGVATKGYAGFWSATGGPGGAGGWSISRRDTAVTTIGSVNATTEPAIPYTVRIEVVPGADPANVDPTNATPGKVGVYLKKDGVTIASATDLSPVPNGKACGLVWYSTTTTSNTAIKNYAAGVLP